MALTSQQANWLDINDDYEPVGPPRPGVKFRECGTLYADGKFERMAPLKPIRMETGCVAVGIREH